MKGDWFKLFKDKHNLEFTEEDYAGWSEMVEQALPFYLKHLPRGSTMLECCSGLGCTAIPLSHYYKVTAFDKDERVLEYTRKNTARFGGDIEIVDADFRRIDEVFGPDSFDATNSGGVLEHYPVDEVRELVDKQLIVAPVVFIDVPLGDGVKTVDEYGITRYNYTQGQWLEVILRNYNIVNKVVSKPHPKLFGSGSHNELLVVVKRKIK